MPTRGRCENSPVSSISIYLDGTPWALPVTVTAFVLLVTFGRRLASRTGTPWLWLVLFGTALAGFLGVIATPDEWVPAGADGGSGNEGGVRQLAWDPRLPGTMLSLANQDALNAWLAVPMGALAGWALVRRARRWPVALVAVAPFVAEGTQWLFPSFGRVAFSVGDLTCNFTGVVIGLGLGAATAGLARLTVRRSAPDTGSRTTA